MDLKSSLYYPVNYFPVEKTYKSIYNNIVSENSVDNENNIAIHPFFADWWDDGPPTDGDGGGGFVGYDAPIGEGLMIIFFFTVLLVAFKIMKRKKQTNKIKY